MSKAKKIAKIPTKGYTFYVKGKEYIVQARDQNEAREELDKLLTKSNG